MRRAVLLLLMTVPLRAQVADRCAPGWSMVNLLREQLTPETPKETLELLQARIGRYLAACREIPDLWYYRSLVAERLHDSKDADYARREAASRNSPALRGNLNPLDAAPSPAAGLPPKLGQKYAVVVGINEFQHTSGLRYAVNDARAFSTLLQDPQVGRFRKENVTTLLDNDATLNGIRTAIGTVRERVRPEDLVVVYIASHGSPRSSDPNGVSYVITHDTKIDNAADLYATSLQMIDLVEILRRDVKARRVVLILDTCYSGDATAFSRGISLPHTDFSAAIDRFEDKTSTGAARVVISASRADEVSREDPALQHGYFTYFLLEALKENAGKLPINDVFQFVHDHTLKAVQDKFGATQTPTMRNTPEALSLILGE